MSEPSPYIVTRRWLRYAEEDLQTAEALIRGGEASPRHCCFFAQQSAEKSLKALLVFLQVEFPFTHDLDTLRDLLPGDWSLTSEHPDLASLSFWAVEARYPTRWPDPTVGDAELAAQQARAVWESVLRDLDRHGFTLTEES